MSSELGTIECTLADVLYGRDGSLVVTLHARKAEANTVAKIFDLARSGQTDPKKRLTAQFAWKRDKRSTDANAYFHVLADKIATALDENKTTVKQMLVCDYGTMCGILTVPRESNPAKSGAEYTRWIGYEGPNSKYILYKPTHTLDTAEMSKLIDGAVSEAKQLGIETKTPDELDRIKALWAEERR